jgi:hypothetical protein
MAHEQFMKSLIGWSYLLVNAAIVKKLLIYVAPVTGQYRPSQLNVTICDYALLPDRGGIS